jgi:hypothetical protein
MACRQRWLAAESQTARRLSLILSIALGKLRIASCNINHQQNQAPIMHRVWCGYRRVVSWGLAQECSAASSSPTHRFTTISAEREAVTGGREHERER